MGMGNIAATGMQSAMSNMDVISNNIANANTGGFKKSNATFADLFPSGGDASGAQIGLGVTLDGVQQNFSPGGYVATGLPSDLAISGSGFFVLKDATSGLTSYSRYGNFQFNQTTGYFSVGNNRMQGFPATNGVITAGSTPIDLRIDVGSQPARASTSVTANGLNLNSGDPIPLVTPFSAANSATYNYTSHTSIYDSLGNSTALDLYYVKTAANDWSVYGMVNGTAINGSSPIGTLSFSSSGQLSGTTGLTGLSYTPTTGAAAMLFDIDMTGTTQYGAPSSTLPFSTDGYGAGIFTKYQIDSSGIVTAIYSNGPNVVVGQVALANFQAPQNLQNVGGSTWLATTASGEPVINPENSSQNLRQGTLEASNVDLATELVNLINAQNTFQANAQVQQTYNEVMQTVTKL